MNLQRAGRSLALAALTLAAVGTAPAAVAHGLPSGSARPANYNCGAGYFCMYDGWNGGGTRCQYRGTTANTADNCPFVRQGRHVLSVWNGNRDTATYFTQTNFHGRVGSTRPGSGGNLMGSYQIRSIRF